VDLYPTVLTTIDARSFSNLWYWLLLGLAWTRTTHRVLGVPWDMVARARRDRGRAEDDLHDLLRVNVLRMIETGERAGVWLLAAISAVLTALGVLGLAYRVEFAQASFLLLAPLVLVWGLSLGAARDLAAGRAEGDALYVRLNRLRRIVQAVGLATIFVTAVVGMWSNLAAGLV
jgi:hypothetical protein